MIVAKVAKVLDNRTVIITAGIDKGVVLGMKFLISSGQESGGSDVIDPDTGEVIGKVAIPKVKVEVTRVDQKYAVAETYEYTTVNEGGNMPSSALIARAFQPPKLVKKYRTFEIEDDQKEEIEKERSLVMVGDLAEQIETS